MTVLTVALISKSQGTDVEVVGGVVTDVIFVGAETVDVVVWLILISALIVVAIAEVVVDVVSVVAPEVALAFTICGWCCTCYQNGKMQ